jgi:hypothetical protein
MTEAEWQAGYDPTAMLEFLRGKASDRKLRLFGAACCREVWDLIVAMEETGTGYGCVAVQLGEQLADGRAVPEAVLVAIEDRVGLMDSGFSPDGHLLVSALPGLAEADALRGAIRTATATGIARGRQVRNQSAAARGERGQPSEKDSSEGKAATLSAWARHADLLRCIFGNPCRPVTFNPSWRTATAKGLARAMYESRDFAAMPILSDALQDAGCDDRDVLAHCRSSSPHVRGCWVLDLVLANE